MHGAKANCVRVKQVLSEASRASSASELSRFCPKRPEHLVRPDTQEAIFFFLMFKSRYRTAPQGSRVYWERYGVELYLDAIAAKERIADTVDSSLLWLRLSSVINPAHNPYRITQS